MDQFALSGGPLLPLILLTMILAPIMEEVGWHGYGVDSLRAGHGLLRATFLFGLLWSLWHAPLALLPGSYQHALAGMESPIFLANFFISVIPAAFVANWIYYRCGRSIAAAVLTHSMLNAAAVLIDAGQVAKCIATLLYAIVAALIVAFDGLFRQGPATFVNLQAQGAKPASVRVGFPRFMRSPRDRLALTARRKSGSRFQPDSSRFPAQIFPAFPCR